MRGIICREEALAEVPEYVKFVEDITDSVALQEVLQNFETLKRGQEVITWFRENFMRVRVSEVRVGGLDGAVVRVSNGESSWRVDGNRYAFPVADREKSEASIPQKARQ